MWQWRGDKESTSLVKGQDEAQRREAQEERGLCSQGRARSMEVGGWQTRAAAWSHGAMTGGQDGPKWEAPHSSRLKEDKERLNVKFAGRGFGHASSPSFLCEVRASSCAQDWGPGKGGLCIQQRALEAKTVIQAKWHG
jgi:hypothetical protein